MSAKSGFILLAGIVVIFLGLEVSSPLILARLSHTEQRITVEMKAAKQLRPLSANGRLAVEQTHYLDWYFGLRRLLEEGVRPSVIVVSLATDQLASRFTLGEAFAHRQVSTRDFPRVVRETNLDRTTATTYFFAHWSRWQADKGFIRQCVMILAIPNFRELAAHIADHGPHVNVPDRGSKLLPWSPND